MNINYLVHSTKGTTWGKHKYVRIENGRYIYPEDLQKTGAKGMPSNVARIKKLDAENRKDAHELAKFDNFKNRTGANGMPTSAVSEHQMQKLSNGWRRADQKYDSNTNTIRDKIHPKEMDNHLNRTSYERYHKNKDVHIENNKNKLPTSAYRQSQETNAKYEPFKVVYNDNLPRKVSDPHTNNHNEIFFDGKSWDEFKATAEKNKKKMQKSKNFIDRLLGR